MTSRVAAAGVREDQDGEQRQDQRAGRARDRAGSSRHRQQHENDGSFDDRHDQEWSFAKSGWHQHLRQDHQGEGDQGPEVTFRRRR